MTKSLLMHLAPLQFTVQVKALADINSSTISVLFQMRGAQRPEDQSSSGEREKAGWDTPLAVPWLLPAKQWHQQDFLKIKSPGAAPCLCSDFWGRRELPLGSSGRAARFAVHLWLTMGWSGKESAGQAQRSSASLHPSRCPGSFFLSSFWINNNDIRRFKHSPVFFTWTYGSQSFYKMLLVNGSSSCKDWGNPVMIFKAIMEYAEFQETHQDHQLQLLAPF